MLKKENIFKQLRIRIMRGEYQPGEKLPGESALAAELKVSRMTLRAALRMLKESGLIRTENRSGNYVRETENRKTYLAAVCGDELEHISVSCLYLVQELQKCLAESGDNLELILTEQFRKGYSHTRWKNRLARGKISGIFLCGGGYVGDEPELGFLKDACLPVVQLLGRPEDREIHDFPVMYHNSSEVLADGVRYLHSLGHTRIATLFKHDHMRGFTRETYPEFLKACGIGSSIELVRYFKRMNQVSQLTRELMFSMNPPTAFMCYCDNSAMRVLETLNELGYQVPEQVSVMGICGYLERLFTVPPLSIVNFHYDLTAQEAVKVMREADQWYGTDRIITRPIPHEIVVKGSTAPCYRMKREDNEYLVNGI